MKKKTAEVVVASAKGKLGSLLGHSVISVMRAAGKHGWTPVELKAALEAQVGKTLLVMPAEHTIKLAIKRGRDEAAKEGGAGGRKIAPLSAKELEVLRVGERPKKSKKGGSKPKQVAATPENVEALPEATEAPADAVSA